MMHNIICVMVIIYVAHACAVAHNNNNNITATCYACVQHENRFRFDNFSSVNPLAAARQRISVSIFRIAGFFVSLLSLARWSVPRQSVALVCGNCCIEAPSDEQTKHTILHADFHTTYWILYMRGAKDHPHEHVHTHTHYILNARTRGHLAIGTYTNASGRNLCWRLWSHYHKLKTNLSDLCAARERARVRASHLIE